jgi:hypothetical protein
VPTSTLLLLLSLAAPGGDPLAALAATLAGLAARDPVQARLEHRLSVRHGDDGAPPHPEGVVQAAASAGSEGLELRWTRALLEQAGREERRSPGDADAPTPTRDALADLQALAVAQLLDAAPVLARALEGATLVEDRPDTRDGQPARLLVLKLTPALGTRDRKYVKELEATGRIWLGADGVPVAAERLVQVKGRAFLVITFESRMEEAWRFTRVGDRLVAVQLERRVKNDGGGEKSERRATTTLALVP